MSNQSTDSKLKEFYSLYVYPGKNKHDSFFKRGVLPKINNYSLARILELGCGSGAVLDEIVDCLPHSEIVAVDRSEIAIHALKKRYSSTENVKIFQRDFVSDSVDDLGAFDFVHCQGVLHHMSDINIALQNINKLLTPDGFVYFWVYNHAGRKEISHFKELTKICSFEDVENAAAQIFKMKRNVGYTTKHKKYMARSDKASVYSKLINLLIMIERYGYIYAIKKYLRAIFGRLFSRNKNKKQYAIGLADEFYNPQEIFFSTQNFIDTVEQHGFRKVEIIDGVSDNEKELVRNDAGFKRFINQYSENFYDIADFIEQPRGIGVIFQKVQ